jgi:hypothetical protein
MASGKEFFNALGSNEVLATGSDGESVLEAGPPVAAKAGDGPGAP